MILVLVLLIIAACLFGLTAIYRAFPPRNDWAGAVVAAGLCVLTIALAFWHAG